MEKRQRCLRNQGRRDGWCWLVASLDVMLSPDGILQSRSHADTESWTLRMRREKWWGESPEECRCAFGVIG